jgi:translation initiation factor IF-3
LSRPFPPRHQSQAPQFRINGKIRAREVRVIGDEGQQLGIMQLPEAIQLARQRGVDVVEIAPNATPPVVRIVDYGKFRYEQEKRQKESKKTVNKVKEVQLSAKIDPHDFQIKLKHAIDFLCEDMTVKASLRFRGREMAHQEVGVQVMQRFVQELGPWGHANNEVRVNGRAINVMIGPLPRQKRAKSLEDGGPVPAALQKGNAAPLFDIHTPVPPGVMVPNRPYGSPPPASLAAPPAAPPPPPPPARPAGFSNNPFANLSVGESGS